MRSMRVLRNVQLLPRSSHALPRSRRTPYIYQHGYCSACEPEPPAELVTKDKHPARPQRPRKALPKEPPKPPKAADHRDLAQEQELYTNSIYSPGSPLFLPNGARMFHKLTDFLRDQYTLFGFEEVITPTIYKKSLWEKSGHWENYADDMYAVTGRGAGRDLQMNNGEGLPTSEEVQPGVRLRPVEEVRLEEGAKPALELQPGQDEEYGLKPMNCPGHCLLFASKQRSYRDLPIRFADFSPLHRNEIHGALSGLTRVRRFHQDDGHIFCRPSQIVEEITKTLKFVELTYSVLGLGPYRLALSTRPKDHFIGTEEEWENAEAGLKYALEASEQKWTINEGDGAFYGPKIDVILTDSEGKEHQTATIQLDFQLPKRFGLEYRAPAPEFEKKGLTTTDPEALAELGSVTPVMIHRAILGSVERLMALLIEHYNGHYPFWLNPRQVMILTVNDSEKVVSYARDVREILLGTDKESRTMRGAVMPGERISVDIDSSASSLAKRIGKAKRERYGVIVVVGSHDVHLNRVVCDFTGIPDPYGRLLMNRSLRKIRKLIETGGMGSGESLKTIDQRLMDMDPKAHLDDLDAAAWKQFPIHPVHLRKFLHYLQQRHM